MAKKHREIQREEDLRNLKNFVEKLVLGQLNVVYCANTRRWKKSTNLFASKHLLALEKVMESWKDLANEIAAKKGDVERMSKDVIVETIGCDDEEEDVGKENDDEKKEVLEETSGNVMDEDVMESIDINNDENAEIDEEKEDEAEALRLKEEEAEMERVRKEKEESERLEKEKQQKIENLKKEQEKTKEKMNEMFKDENDEQPKDDEFPWDD